MTTLKQQVARFNGIELLPECILTNDPTSELPISATYWVMYYQLRQDSWPEILTALTTAMEVIEMQRGMLQYASANATNESVKRVIDKTIEKTQKMVG